MEGLVVLIVVWIIFGGIGLQIGESKGRNGGFWLGFLLGPLGLLILLFLPRSLEKEAERQLAIKKRREELEREMTELETRRGGGRGSAPVDEDEAQFRRWREKETKRWDL